MFAYSFEVQMSFDRIEKIAERRQTTPMQAQLRLKLIRSLKKFLYIAGIHNEEAADDSAHAEVSTVLSEMVKRVENDSIMRGSVENVLNDLVTDTAVRVAEHAALAATVARLVTAVEQRAADFAQVASVVAQLVTAVEIAVEVSVQLTALCDDVAHQVELEQAHSLSTISAAPRHSSPSKQSNRSAIGQPYTVQEDFVVWSAWQANDAAHTDGLARKNLEWSLACTLNRTDRGIEKRLAQLQEVAKLANDAVEGGATLLPGQALRAWERYCERLPAIRINCAYLDTRVVSELEGDMGVSYADLVVDLDEVRVLKWFLLMSGVHQGDADPHTPGDSGASSSAEQYSKDEPQLHTTSTSPLPPAPLLITEHPLNDGAVPTIADIVREMVATVEIAVSVHVVADDIVLQVEHNAAVRATVTDVIELLVQQAESSVFVDTPSTHAADSECGLCHAASEPSAAPQPTISVQSLPASTLPFAFKLHDEGEMWRVYLQERDKSGSTLTTRLTDLALRLGCSFAQIRAHLSALISLQLGLTAQPHSTGRSFTTTEDTAIWAALGTAPAVSYAMSLLLVAQRLRRAVGAVAGRHRQLRTLRLLEEVNTQTHVACASFMKRPLTARRVGKKRTLQENGVRTTDGESKRKRKRNKGETACYRLVRGENSGSEMEQIGYFSTERESDDVEL